MQRRIQFLAIGLAARLFLGQQAAADSSYAVDAWNTADGLPQGSVIAITQTHDGYLWLGTLNGLVRFDGNSMTKFNVDNTPGLPDNIINFLFEDNRSNLWAGTANGRLCTIRAGAIKSLDVTSMGERIIGANDAGDGVVRFCTANANAFAVTNGQLTPLAPLPLDLFSNSFHVAVHGKNGTSWRLQGGHVLKYHGPEAPRDFGPFPWNSSLVLGQIGEASLPIDLDITAMCLDRDDNLIVGTHDSGVYWYDANGGFTHISTDKGFSQNIVLSLYCDREGDVWAGTDGDGLERISKKAFTVTAGTAPGAPVSIAESIAEDAAGGIWTAFDRRGLTYAISNSTTDFLIGTFSNATTVLVDSRQQVWAGTRPEGLFRFAAGRFQPVPQTQPIGPQIFALFQSRDGTLWVGGQNGLASFDGRKWKIFSPGDGLPRGAIRACAEDTNATLWFASDRTGIFQLINGRIHPVPAPVTDVSCLLADREGSLWAGTFGHGLARLDGTNWTTFSSRDGLLGDDIGYLIEDDFTNLWLGSYEGLVRAEKKSLTEPAAGAARKIACRTFLTCECSIGAQPAALRTRDGRLLFPTIEGLVSVNPAALRPNTNPPPVVIESVLIDGVPQKSGLFSPAWPDEIVLEPENEQLEIHFTALSFSAPKGAQFGAQFRYQLEGRDNKPVDIGNERVARFGHLAAGSYTFHVTACNEDGNWNNTGASLAINVLPPFWRKPGFLAASLLGCLAALAGAIYLVSTAKLRRQLRIAQQKELVERERARIARDLHDQLGANLTQITLLGEMAEADKELPAEIVQHAEQICATARDTTRSLDEIVWAVNPSNDTLESLANYVCKYAQDYFATAGVSYRAELPPGLPPTPILPEVRHNVFLAFKEAVNNVVKHARATEARVSLHLEPQQFILAVADNGRGLGDLSEKKLRNGLKNMRRRLSDVHGQFEIGPGPAGGTIVRLTVPLGNHV